MDASLNQTCSHVVSGVLYTTAACPRCLGEGVYKDFGYDKVGHVSTVVGSEKLKQEILKMLATADTPFHPEYGAKLKTRIGKAFDPAVAKSVVKADMVQAVQLFMAIQEGASNLLPSETVRSIISAEAWIIDSEPRRVYGSIKVENAAATPITLNTTVNT